LAAALAGILAGCIGPWDGLPDDTAVQIRAAAAVFVQPGKPAEAAFTRPLDGASESQATIPWIDAKDSTLWVEETCRDKTRSSSFTGLSYATSDKWSASLASSTMDSCATGRTWRFRGHLRWNASSPFSLADPLYATDSVDVQAETSTAPVFTRTGLYGSVETRWRELALSNDATRRRWSQSPDSLVALAARWKALQSRRGLASTVLYQSAPVELDTALLRSVLSYTGIAMVALSPTDTLWLPSDRFSLVQANVAATTGFDFYRASLTRWSRSSFSLTDIVVPFWAYDADWIAPRPGSGSDTVGTAFYAWREYSQGILELAVAGTCDGQRAWLHEGGSNRYDLPHGNAGPFDGFVCEVRTDTMTFVLGD
jgi:hypothetical protein